MTGWDTLCCDMCSRTIWKWYGAFNDHSKWICNGLATSRWRVARWYVGTRSVSSGRTWETIVQTVVGHGLATVNINLLNIVCGCINKYSQHRVVKYPCPTTVGYHACTRRAFRRHSPHAKERRIFSPPTTVKGRPKMTCEGWRPKNHHHERKTSARFPGGREGGDEK